MHRCYGAGVIYVSFIVIIFIYFQFWDGIQNVIRNMWQVAFANIFIQARAVNSYVCINSYKINQHPT